MSLYYYLRNCAIQEIFVIIITVYHHALDLECHAKTLILLSSGWRSQWGTANVIRNMVCFRFSQVGDRSCGQGVISTGQDQFKDTGLAVLHEPAVWKYSHLYFLMWLTALRTLKYAHLYFLMWLTLPLEHWNTPILPPLLPDVADFAVRTLKYSHLYFQIWLTLPLEHWNTPTSTSWCSWCCL